MSTHTATTDTWFIAHNGAGIVHHGLITEGQEVATGQPNLELFATAEEWKARLKELGVKVEDR